MDHSGSALLLSIGLLLAAGPLYAGEGAPNAEEEAARERELDHSGRRQVGEASF